MTRSDQTYHHRIVLLDNDREMIAEETLVSGSQQYPMVIEYDNEYYLYSHTSMVGDATHRTRYYSPTSIITLAYQAGEKVVAEDTTDEPDAEAFYDKDDSE